MASLREHEKGLIVLILPETEAPSLLQVLTNGNLGLGDLSCFVGLLPDEGHALGSLVPEDLLNLIGC